MSLQSLAENIWCQTRDLMMPGGINLGTRMAVVRLAGGELLLYSPVGLTEELKAALDALGPVRYLIAPNQFHHLFVSSYLDTYPEARLYCVSGLLKKRPDLRYAVVLEGAGSYPWSEEMPHQLVAAGPAYTEYVLYHPVSRTLLLTDLIMNVRLGNSLKARLVSWLAGFRPDRPVVTRLERYFLIKDRARVGEAVRQMLAWDPERIFLTHGETIPAQGRQVLAEAYSYLLA